LFDFSASYEYAAGNFQSGERAFADELRDRLSANAAYARSLGLCNPFIGAKNRLLL